MVLPECEIAVFARIVQRHHESSEMLPTKRELTVAYLAVVQGRTINQIATYCGASPRTIETQRRTFIEKLTHGHGGLMWKRLRIDFAEAMEREAQPV